MIRIEQTAQFKRDIKRYKHKRGTLIKLFAIVELLANEQPLPPKVRAHKLKGNYAGHLECHVESDTLLIWIKEEKSGEKIIELSRFGSHAELF